MGQSWKPKCFLYSQYVLCLWPAATWPGDESNAIRGETTCHGEFVLAEVWGCLFLSQVQCRSEARPYSRVWCISFFLYLSCQMKKSLWGTRSHILFLLHQGELHFNTFSHSTWSQESFLKLLHVRSEITPHPPKHLHTQFPPRSTALRKRGV